MEEFDEDDFSDLYADVEVQASSALSAMQRSTKLPARSGSVVSNATRGEKKAADGLSGVQSDGENRKLDERDAAFQVAVKGKGGGSAGGLRNLSVDNGDGCGSERESESESENEASLDSDSDDGSERKVDENCESEKYDDRESDVELGEIAGKEKSLNGGDGFAQREKKKVDEMAQEVIRTFKKGDADDRDPFFSRACEDNQPNYGRRHGGTRMASERHTQASDPVTLDLDEPGSVQISDSVEDSSREVSGSDLEGMSETSDDRNRRQVSCIYNKVSPTIKPESSESSKSQHGRSYSCSPRQAAHGSRYFKNSSKRSRYSPSSLRCESQQPTSCEVFSPKDSEKRYVKRCSRDGRYDRWRDSMREHYNQPKKSNYMFKNRSDEDASYAIDAKHLYNRHANRGKQRAMVTFDYNENNIPYYSQSERILTYSGVRFPDHHLGPAFLKDQYWDVPNCRYRVVRPDCDNMRERQDFLNNKSNRIGYEALEYNRHHNHGRHHFQDDIKGLRNLSPKYSAAVNQRSTHFMYKEDTLRHRRRTRRHSLSPLREYDDRSLEGKHRRFLPSSVGDRDRDPLVSSCDRNVARDRREVESSGHDKRRCLSPLNSLESLCYIETEVDDRRNIRHQRSPFYSSKEPYASSRGGFAGAAGPKSVVTHRNIKNIRSSWKEMRIERGQYGTDVFVARESARYHPSDDYHIQRSDYRQTSNTSVMGGSIKDDQYQDHFVGRRHHQHSEVLQSREDFYKSRQQDNTVFSSEEPSYNYKRISKNVESDDKLALSRVKELRGRETFVQNSSMLREEDNNELFDGYLKSAQHHSQGKMHPRHQYSVDRLVIEGRKCTLQSSIRRTTGAGEDTFYGRRDLKECNEKQTNNFEDLDKSNPEKTVPTDQGKVDSSLSNRNQHSKLSRNQHNGFLDIEEGQIITEELQKATKCTPTSEDASKIKGKVHQETAPDGNGVTERLDDEKIREIMKKMERRRERFKEQITTSRDYEKPSSPLPESSSGTAEARLERPARKRKWV